MSLHPADHAGPTESRFGLKDEGLGRPILLLHGGDGPATMAALATALAAGHRVLTPTYPDFDGTPRPPRLASITGLAEFYVELDCRNNRQPLEAFHCLRQRNLCLFPQSVKSAEKGGRASIATASTLAEVSKVQRR